MIQLLTTKSEKNCKSSCTIGTRRNFTLTLLSQFNGNFTSLQHPENKGWKRMGRIWQNVYIADFADQFIKELRTLGFHQQLVQPRHPTCWECKSLSEIDATAHSAGQHVENACTARNSGNFVSTDLLLCIHLSSIVTVMYFLSQLNFPYLELQQVFSNSVVQGLRFYLSHDPSGPLKGCEETMEFCKRMNDMFDALNRKTPNEGLTPGNKDFKVIIILSFNACCLHFRNFFYSNCTNLIGRYYKSVLNGSMIGKWLHKKGK